MIMDADKELPIEMINFEAEFKFHTL